MSIGEYRSAWLASPGLASTGLGSPAAASPPPGEAAGRLTCPPG